LCRPNYWIKLVFVSFSPKYKHLNDMQASCYEEAMNGCTATERAKLVLAWVAAERMKREMRGIPPLKAIAAPWPMKKARVRQITDAVEVEAKESLCGQTVTAPEPVTPPSAPIDSLVHPPSHSTTQPIKEREIGGSKGVSDNTCQAQSCRPGEEKYPWKANERKWKADYLARKKAKDGRSGNSEGPERAPNGE
jgi:hypothetical protein